MDWTFDYFVNDINAYGVEDKNSKNYNAYFVAMIKEIANEFKDKWNEENSGKASSRGNGWNGDAFNEWFDWSWFSDFYKDTYGQRPHLPKWYYTKMLGFCQTEDTFRTFCAEPIEDAIWYAQETRKQLD